MEIMPMTTAYAADIATWRYLPPYDCYDMPGVDPAALADPDNGFFALTDASGLLGFRSFGSDGRVPGGTYDDSALDTGGGLRPELTGKGLGRHAFQAGLASGWPGSARLHSASPWQPSTSGSCVIQDLGFSEVARFEATTNGARYVVLVRDESQ